MKDVFPTQKNTDSTVVFDLGTVKNFESLTLVFCSNYYNKGIRYFIRTSKNDIPFSIRNNVYCNVVCNLINYKNILFVDYYGGSLFYHNGKNYNFNAISFEKTLKKQFLNNGKDSRFTDNPNKNMIFLEFLADLNDSKKELKNKLDTISVSYFNFIKSFHKQNIDSLKRVYPLQILLEPDFRSFDVEGNIINHKSPPPAPIEIVE